MMRDVMKDRARALIERMGTAVSLTTASGAHAARGIHRAPHAAPTVGYGMSSQAAQDVLDMLLEDAPDVTRGSQVQINAKRFDVVEVKPDEYQVMARLALVEAQA